MKDDAIAEIVGVILIIAITVAVAAVVASYALDLGSALKKPYQVYFNINRPSPNDSVVITNVGGTDQDFLKTIEISYTNATGIQTAFAQPNAIITSNSGYASGDLTNKSTTSFELSPSIVDSYGNCNVIVRGTFLDGTQQVLVRGTV